MFDVVSHSRFPWQPRWRASARISKGGTVRRPQRARGSRPR